MTEILLIIFTVLYVLFFVAVEIFLRKNIDSICKKDYDKYINKHLNKSK